MSASIVQSATQAFIVNVVLKAILAIQQLSAVNVFRVNVDRMLIKVVPVGVIIVQDSVIIASATQRAGIVLVARSSTMEIRLFPIVEVGFRERKMSAIILSR